MGGCRNRLAKIFGAPDKRVPLSWRQECDDPLRPDAAFFERWSAPSWRLLNLNHFYVPWARSYLQNQICLAERASCVYFTGTIKVAENSHINFWTKTDSMNFSTEPGALVSMASPMSVTLGHPNEIAGVSDWDVDFHQIERGKLEMRVSLFGNESMQLTSIRMSKMARQTGSPPKGWRTFGIADPLTIKTWQSHELNHSNLLSFSPSGGFESTSLGGHNGIVMSFKDEVFDRYLGVYDTDLECASDVSRAFAGDGCPELLSGLNRLVLSTLSEGSQSSIGSVQDDIAFAIISFLDGAVYESPKLAPRYREKILKRAASRILEAADENLSIGAICEEEGIPWRTLNRAFRDEYGVGPKTFHKYLRLNRVRLDLVERNEIASVTDVANRYDFWHMGQFAKDYRNLFGELPSETLSGC